MSFMLKFTKNPFSLIIAIMILYVVFALYIDVGKLSKTTVRIDYLTIPSIFIPMTLTILVLGYRFHRLLGALNSKILIKKSISIYVAGLAFALTPLSSGQVIKSQILKK